MTRQPNQIAPSMGSMTDARGAGRGAGIIVYLGDNEAERNPKTEFLRVSVVGFRLRQAFPQFDSSGNIWNGTDAA
jgi:hypothetical protein